MTVAEPPPPSGWRKGWRALRTLAVGYGLVAACGAAWSAVDEAAVPSGRPDLPAGVSVAAEELACGSGGCWRELTLGWDDGLTRQDAVDLVRPLVGCGVTHPITFRRSCTELDATPGGPPRLVLRFG